VRVFFGFYQNIVDTFKKIPFRSNSNGVFDNLVGFDTALFARDGGRRDLLLPFSGTRPSEISPALAIDTLVGLLTRETDLPPSALAHLGQSLAIYLSSCDARRLGQWENTKWTDFAGAGRFGHDYDRIVVHTFAQEIQASKTEHTSANFCAHVLEWFVYNLVGLDSTGPLLRMLNLPTNEALVGPWCAELRRLGVSLRDHHELVGLEMHRGRISGARVRAHGRTDKVDADWYVCALPVDRARRLLSSEIRKADPSLRGMDNLSTDWMNGIKFFLREYKPLPKDGLVFCVDSPFALGGASPAQAWPVDFADTYGDGTVRDCISLIIPDWHSPGVVYGKPAKQLTPRQVARDAWEQLKAHVNGPGDPILTDAMLHSWDIDPGMKLRNGHLVSQDTMVLPAVGEYADRPNPGTKIPNLVLTGDYLQSGWEVANMETANYNGRRSANEVIMRSGSSASDAVTIDPYRPPEWEPFKRIDEDRYKRGQSNLFDASLSAEQVSDLLRLHS
jgi:uncharacterized protein with NAD-binding domain and iron-sulfur cluster